MLPRTSANSEPSTRQGKVISLCLWTSVFLVCLGAFFFLVKNPSPPAPKLPPPPDLAPKVARNTRFFDDHVQPAIKSADKANRAAVKRCLQRLRDSYSKQREGIAPFTDDITSLWTRLGVLKRMPFDWWNNQKDVQKMISAKFEKHLFSQQSLEEEIQDALSKFREDVDANSNELLTSVRAAVSKANLPKLPPLDYGEFHSGMTQSIEKYAADSATGSVTNGILTELVSGVGGAVASQLLVNIGLRIAAMVGTSTATAGGTTAAGAAVGGGSGTVVGPVGTAVGFGVGLVVGVAADWWMTSNFKARLGDQLNTMFNEMEQSVIEGTSDRPGLKQSLLESCDFLRVAIRQTLYNRIVEETI